MKANLWKCKIVPHSPYQIYLNNEETVEQALFLYNHTWMIWFGGMFSYIPNIISFKILHYGGAEYMRFRKLIKNNFCLNR